MPSLFTRIINWEIPSYKIYEDEHTFAFLDIYPIQRWHILIIPKTEVDHMLDVPEPYYSAIWQSAKTIGKALHAWSDKKKVANLVLWFGVDHAHLHLVPIDREADTRAEPMQLSEEEMKEIQEWIIKQLEKQS